MRATLGNPPPTLYPHDLATLAAATSTRTLTCDAGKGILTTTLKVKAPTALTCIKVIEATFYWKAKNRSTRVDIGYAWCNLIDRAVTDKNGQKLWLQELLNTGYGDCDVPESVNITRHLFEPDGGLRDAVKQHAAFLNGDDPLLHVDTFMLRPAHRSKKLGAHALAALHDVLPKLNNGFAFSGPVILSPCNLSTTDSAKYLADKGLTSYQQEEFLIKFYQKAGYTLFLRGTDEVDGTINVMGRSV